MALKAKLDNALPEASLESAGWYVLRLSDLKFQGPAILSQVGSALGANKLSWTDYAYHPEHLPRWGRLIELHALLQVIPPIPDLKLLKKCEEVASTKANVELKGRAAEATPIHVVSWKSILESCSKKVPRLERFSRKYWYLLLDGYEVGPVELRDLENAYRSAPSPESVYVWNKGMRRWRPADTVPEVARILNRVCRILPDEPSLLIERGTQRRKSSRHTLLASIFRIAGNGAAEMLGICGDVSPDGFQLVQYDNPKTYTVGQEFSLEVRTSKTSDVVSFKLRAVVKWFDPNTQLVGFETTVIDPVDRKLLDRYASKRG